MLADYIIAVVSNLYYRIILSTLSLTYFKFDKLVGPRFPTPIIADFPIHLLQVGNHVLMLVFLYHAAK